MTALRVIVSPSAATRQDEALRFLAGFPPLTEAIVASATREAADDLVRQLAVSRGGVFGLHRFGFWQLVGRIAALEVARAEMVPASRLGAEALAARSISEALDATDLEYFEPVARCRGFAGTLAATLNDLRLAGVESTALSLDQHVPRLPPQYASSRDLSRLAARYETLLTTGKVADRAALLRMASTAVNEARSEFPSTRPVVLLDVPIGSAGEVAFIDALASGASSLLVTVPSGDTRTLASLKALTGSTIVEPDRRQRASGSSRRDRGRTTEEDDLGRLRERLFALDDPIPGKPKAVRSGVGSSAGEPSRVVFFSAPGEGRECVEIARTILSEAGEGVRFDQMAVVLRAPHLYTALLETALKRADIPAWFSRGTRVPDPSGRAFLALLLCRTEDLSARRFAEYLSFGQVPPLNPAGAPPDTVPAWVLPDDDEGVTTAGAAQSAPPTTDDDERVGPDTDESPVLAGTLRAPWQWDRFLVEAAVIGSRDRWVRRLDGLARQWQLERDETASEEPDSPRVQRIERDLGDLEHLRRFALPVIDALATLPELATWGEWLEHLEALAPRVLRRPARVLATLAELRPMATVGPVTLPEVRDVLRDRLTTLHRDPPVRRYGRVWVGTPEELRGRAFDVVFVPGLAERIFPQRPREDPLLLDDVRRAVNEESGGGSSPRLPTMADRVQQERAHLQLAAGAVRERLYLSYPRMELSESRPRVPSFYALDIQRALSGRVPDINDLEREADETAGARLAWPAPLDPVRAIDDAEHDLAVLGRLLHQRTETDVRGRAQYLLELSETLGRSLRARWARWQRKWSSADGLYRPAAPGLAALQHHRLRARPYSISALQRYATCPYQFLLSAIYRLEPRAVAVRIERLDPLTKGSLTHRILADAIRRFDRHSLLPITDASLTDAKTELDSAVAEAAAQYYDDLAPAIDRVWRDEIASIRADVHGWLERMARDSGSWRPLHTEFGFGFGPGGGRDPGSRPDPVTLEDGWSLHGVVDLVERHTTSPTLRVTDHKTGANRTRDRQVVGGGEVLQPVLYGMAVESTLNLSVTESRLSFCTARGGYTSRTVPMGSAERRAGLEVLEIIDRGVEGGILVPAPREAACRWCDFREVCGPYEEGRIFGRRGRLRGKDPSPLQDLLHLRDMP